MLLIIYYLIIFYHLVEKTSNKRFKVSNNIVLQWFKRVYNDLIKDVVEKRVSALEKKYNI